MTTSMDIEPLFPGLTEEQKKAGSKVCKCRCAEQVNKDLGDLMHIIEDKYPSTGPRFNPANTDTKMSLQIGAVKGWYLKALQVIIDKCVCP